ncbi:MAG TPA: porin [Humisphaera sp.]
MASFTRRLAPAVLAAAAAVGLAGSTARADQASTQSEIEALKARIAQLEAQQSKASAAAVNDALATKAVADVIADADRRSQTLQAGGFMAGYTDKGFIIQSEDGAFSLHPNAQLLFRHASTMREDVKTTGGDDVQSGFEVRRMKFGLDGNLFTKDLKYFFLWATDRKSGNLVLEEAWVDYKLTDALTVRAGQYKDFFSHEAMGSSKRLFAAERSLLNDVFTGGDNFVQGAGLIYDRGGPLRAYISYTDGANAPNQNFQDAPTNKANFGFAGRVEYKVFGDWKAYEDFTTIGNKTDTLVLGAGADYTEAGDTDTLLHTLDAQYETGPLATYAAFLGRTVKQAGPDRYDYGFVAQAGYLINGRIEPFVRYDYIHFDQRGIASPLENDVHEITLGVNYYFKGHAAKVTADFTWLPNGSPVTNDGGDILATPAGQNEYILRLQFQLLI